jgi:hypothetical protein
MSHHPLNLTNPGRKVHAGVILMGGYGVFTLHSLPVLT